MAVVWERSQRRAEPEDAHRTADVTCVILAGGESRRMGENKAFVRIGNDRMLDQVLSVCRKIFPEIIIATKNPDLFQDYGATVVEDKVALAGPLCGIYTGLLAARHDYIFCVGCDMPLLNEWVIRYLLRRRFDYHIVVPRIYERLEPLHAVYSKKCTPMIEKCLEKGALAIPLFFHEARTLYCEAAELAGIDPLLVSFTNVNTKEQLRLISERYATSGERRNDLCVDESFPADTRTHLLLTRPFRKRGSAS